MIKQIFCGDKYSIALLENNEIVVWGDNSGGQHNVPKINKMIKKISCGLLHCVALLEDDTVISWGKTSKENMNLFGIKDIACSDFSTTILYKNNTVKIF